MDWKIGKYILLYGLSFIYIIRLDIFAVSWPIPTPAYIDIYIFFLLSKVIETGPEIAELCTI